MKTKKDKVAASFGAILLEGFLISLLGMIVTRFVWSYDLTIGSIAVLANSLIYTFGEKVLSPIFYPPVYITPEGLKWKGTAKVSWQELDIRVKKESFFESIFEIKMTNKKSKELCIRWSNNKIFLDLVKKHCPPDNLLTDLAKSYAIKHKLKFR